ncbi:hypothetical protein GCM10019059_39200 [Camelimonas fluminis]|nr:hypothetical protein GCM10019059_39200 [Camelimonas fluminis]
MDHLHRAGHIDANAARDSVRNDLDNGADPKELYATETDQQRKVILIGVLRRGRDALEHFPRKG